MFFCLETKEPKIQDWIFLAKKVFITLKDLKLARQKVLFINKREARSNSKSFLTLHYNFFLTQKAPRSFYMADAFALAALAPCHYLFNLYC